MHSYFSRSLLAAAVGLAVVLPATAGAADFDGSARRSAYINPAAHAEWSQAQVRQQQSAERTGITVLPIDRAKFWQGQRFDFEVEIAATDLTDVSITLNGQPIERALGGKLTRTVHDDYTSLRIDNVSFAKTGPVTLTVNAAGSSGKYQRTVSYQVVREQSPKRAKNVILFVGDGMSMQVKQAARILSRGITEGRYDGLLAMEQMPAMGLVTTSGYDSLVTDSANSASAYNTGHKSVVNAMGVYANRTPDPLDDPKVENINEFMQRTRGMSVGMVTTAAVTDATPAAVSAHTRRRAEEPFIATDFLTEMHRPDVILGGGARSFLPLSTPGSKRKDETNVIAAFEQNGFTFAENREQMLAAPKDKPLLGLFTMSHMNVYMDREFRPNPEVTKGFNDQPNLIEMTAKALDHLSQNPNGFYLMSEGASIDKQLHTMDWQRAVYDAIEFDQAVSYARDWAKAHGDNTLIIVLADHAHGLSLTGTYHENDGKAGREGVRTYGAAGWTTFADRNGDGFPDNPDPSVTLAFQYANFPDHYENYRFQAKPTAPAIVGENDKIIANPYRAPQGARYIEGNLPQYLETQEVHSADDIVVMAEGPGSEYFHGVMDNTDIFFGIMRALHADPKERV